MKLVVGVFVIFCIIFDVHAINAKSSSSDFEVHRSLILRNFEEKPRGQRPGIQQRPGGGGLINTNLVPDIVCFYARYGRWPNYPQYLRQSVRWMSQLVFSMSDEGVRSFCRQFNYFTGLDKRTIGGPTRRTFQNRRTTRRRFITTRRGRTNFITRRRRTTTTEPPFYDSTFYDSSTEFPSGSVTDPPTGSGTGQGNNNNNGQGSGSSASGSGQGNPNTAPESQGNTGTGQSASSGSSGNLIATFDSKPKLKKMKYYGIDMLKPIPFYP